MFTHPSLLRQLNRTAEFLRACGETGWASRVAAEADFVRKQGWTEIAARHLQGLFKTEPYFHQLTLGDERRERLAGRGKTPDEANQELAVLRQGILDQMQVPPVPPRNPDQAQKRSPDLPLL